MAVIRLALLIAALALSAGAAQAVELCDANAAGVNGGTSWISIKDSCHGLTAAAGNGTTDDTAAIQAHIDYAYNHGLLGVYCPAGNYKTTSTIYLGLGSDLTTVLAGGDPTTSQYSMSFFGDPASSGAHLAGCVIKPTFNNGIGFLVGAGNSMRVSDIAVTGPNNGYRANLSQAGIGIGVAGASGGATGTLIENTYVSNFYHLYMTDANNACCLSDSNTFRKVGGDNGYVGIELYNTQSFINTIEDPYLDQVTIGVDSRWSHQVNIFGGNISAITGANGSFGISSTGAFFQGTGCNDLHPGGWCFSTTIASPDAYIGTPVYDSYTIVTASFGVIPLQMVSYNSSTHVAVFGMWLPWLYGNYGSTSAPAAGSMATEIQAASTVYAAERVRVVRGMSITIDGTHVENDRACTTLYEPVDVWGGLGSGKVKDVFFDYDPSGIVGNFSQAEKYCQEAFPFIGGNQSGFDATNAALRIEGGNWASATQPVLIDAPPSLSLRGTNLSSPGIPAKFNVRVFDGSGLAYSQLGGASQFATVARGAGRWDNDYFVPSGATGNLLNMMQAGELTGEFCGYEPCPWTTPNLSPTLFALACPSASGGGSYGAAYTCGALSALGSNPPIACRTRFGSVDWNTGSIAAGITKRSASCPGYSWGQNLTQATVGATANASGTGSISGTTLTITGSPTGSYAPGDMITGTSVTANTYIIEYISATGGAGTYRVNQSQSVSSTTITAPSVTYSGLSGSDVLYVDASLMKWMFPGLGITLSGHAYTITGVFPYLGYVTVIDGAANTGAPLQATYQCSSSCTVGQAAFAWAAY